MAKKIIGLESILTSSHLHQEIQQGGKFVVYQYCISLLVITFKRFSDIHFVRSEENALAKGLLYSLISLLLGWWGLPWGPIYTIQSFVVNFGGGKDVTREVLASTTPPAQ